MAGGGLVFLEIDEAEHKFYNDTVLCDANGNTQIKLSATL